MNPVLEYAIAISMVAALMGAIYVAAPTVLPARAKPVPVVTVAPFMGPADPGGMDVRHALGLPPLPASSTPNRVVKAKY